jgi:hypothetical protein
MDHDPVLFFFRRAASWGQMGALAWERWWRWHGGRRGPRLIAVGSSLPRRRCPCPNHRSCSSRCRCNICRRRYSSVGMSPHLVPFSRWLTGCRPVSPPPPLDASLPHVGSSHLRERRESMPISAHGRATPSFPHPHPRSAGSPYSATCHTKVVCGS